MYFEVISGTIDAVAEDLHFYKDYATVLYAKWDKVQTVRLHHQRLVVIEGSSAL